MQGPGNCHMGALTFDTSRRTIHCWLYLIRNFPEKMLAKKLLTSYHNTPEQPYNEKSVRTVPAREDLSY